MIPAPSLLGRPRRKCRQEQFCSKKIQSWKGTQYGNFQGNYANQSKLRDRKKKG
jgi:hypothetical protein